MNCRLTVIVYKSESVLMRASEKFEIPTPQNQSFEFTVCSVQYACKIWGPS